ncbi:hypothetical protein BD94_0970 [Elizabethkingia anophelis NUHP1]|uniref:Uncharacterized protein n=1 Tax=Elizabethkingia anophelis NUHP1 TaxID=1338011 RepID=A0A077EGU2_9FLAO|nr:hypothetical protein BD94_0970 [Elizabethkingia anophelis NUHP1]
MLAYSFNGMLCVQKSNAGINKDKLTVFFYQQAMSADIIMKW